MDRIFGGVSGLLRYEHPNIFSELAVLLHHAGLDVDSLSFVSTSRSDLHPDSILIVVGVHRDAHPDLAERFGDLEYHIPVSESSVPDAATRGLASAIVQRWAEASNP